MGTTCTSLHILRPLRKAGDLSDDVAKAYARLGYARLRKPGQAEAKRVALTGGAESKFVSIHDRENAEIDSGEMKDLAVRLSKALKTTAVLTSVYDSDRFEFVVFHNGKQIDAAVGDADAHEGGLKILPPRKRSRPQPRRDMGTRRDRRRSTSNPSRFRASTPRAGNRSSSSSASRPAPRPRRRSRYIPRSRRKRPRHRRSRSRR